MAHLQAVSGVFMIPPMSRASNRRTKKNRGGRPTLDDDTLLRNRNAWIHVLLNAWGDVGWLLAGARQPSQLREAFALVLISTSEERDLIKPFLRDTSIRVTGDAVRRTQKAWKTATEREARHAYDGSRPRYHILTDSVRESEDALRTALPDSQDRLRREHARRVTLLEAFRSEEDRLKQQRMALETPLANQAASYAQHELLKFIQVIRVRKHDYSPLTLARGVAGLPDMGCSQSFRRCGNLPIVKVSSSRYRSFKIIAKAWGDRSERSAGSLLRTLAKRICRIHTTDSAGAPDYHAIAFRESFRDNWRFLKQAVEAANVADGAPGAVPYSVLREYLKRSTNPTAAERVMAAEERLDCP